jgi:RND family efflux transporter MFP subunit
MKFQKIHSLIIAFITLWIIFIGWGIVKTTLKLSREKVPSPDTEIKRTVVKKEEPKAKGKEVTVALDSLLQPSITMVRAFKAKVIDFKDILPVMGTIKGNKEVELRFETAGKVKEVNFQEGDRVGKGQVLARLDPKESLLKLEYYKARMFSAKAAYEAIKKKLQINEELYKAGGVIELKFEEAKLECDKAELDWQTTIQELNMAQNELKKNILTAPMEGVIGLKSLEVGEYVTPNKKVTAIMDVSDVMVEAGIIERDIEKIILKQRAEVYVDAYPEQEFFGVINNIFPVVEGKSRTLTIKIKVANPKNLLLPGMFCRANISLVELKNAIIIPTKAVIKVGGNITVVPIVSCGAFSPEEIESGAQLGNVELRRVKLGYSTADYTQIVAGVRNGELVVIESQGELIDRMKVKVVGSEEMIAEEEIF